MNKKVRLWYLSAFPDDDLGKDILSKTSFQDIYNALLDRKDIYKVIGVGDSVIRERCFHKLSEITGISYSEIKEKWLD